MEQSNTYLKECREKSGLAVKEFADFVGCSPKSIDRYEKGLSQPSIQTAKRMAKVLNISLDELFRDVE